MTYCLTSKDTYFENEKIEMYYFDSKIMIENDLLIINLRDQFVIHFEFAEKVKD
jgi:hypothetical protein